MSQQYQKQKQKWKQQGREEAISEFKEKVKEIPVIKLNSIMYDIICEEIEKIAQEQKE